jgi:lipid-A-disaccharide synthase-like uncharacterized protein
MDSWIVYSIGFAAQLLFSSRILVQWIISEKNKKVLTPNLFWKISLIASMFLFIYGYLRHDFPIMLGQVITYYIYIRNIQLEHEWDRIHRWLRVFLYFFPVVILIYGYNNNIMDRANLFNKDNISTILMILGVISQVLFSLRFVYQLIYSERKKESILPMGFWIMSFAGSSLILIYAIFRKDPVLFLAHLSGLIVYSRNIYILKRYEV